MVRDKEKQDIRKQLLDKLLSLTQEELKRGSANVIRILSQLPIYKNAHVIMAYFPLKGEVDTLEMVRKELEKRFCFPVMDLEKKDLKAFEVKNLDSDFVRGPYGIKQPYTKMTREVNINDIDIVIVPGLAFDYQRNRLGRGGGFYDRFLKKLSPPTKKVGIAFDFQILERLPTNLTFDERVDLVVSEHSVI